MAITITVETGAVVDGANSFVTLVQADAYAETHPGATAWRALADEARKATLVQAARVMTYNIEWDGTKVDSDQDLAEPRNYTYDEEGTLYANDEVPQRVLDAQCELAIKLQATDYTADPSPSIVREKVDVLEVQYSERGSSSQRSPVPDIVMNMLGSLVKGYAQGAGGTIRVSRG